MAKSPHRRAIRWLREQLPLLVSNGVITPEASRAIQRHYDSSEARQSNFGFVLLAIVGSALIGAGIVLLIEHNWDELSRAARSTIAFLPLFAAQALGVFVLWRRNESKPWRESVAISDIAAVATAIALISQTYQLQGTFADFMQLWLILIIPVVYLFRTTVGAVGYIIGTVAWLFAKADWLRNQSSHLFFWLFLLAVGPYYLALLRRNRYDREAAALSILLVGAATIGLGFTTTSAQSTLGGIAFGGFFTVVYLCGMRFFQSIESQRLPALALLGGFGVGVTAIVLSFEPMWHMTPASSWALEGSGRAVAIAIELFFPLVAIALLAWDYTQRRRVAFSLTAAVMPLVTALAWMIANLAPATKRTQDSSYSLMAALIFDAYALILGSELMARGVRANSVLRANFGLIIITGLALSRFFDSDLDFVTRGLGFILVGAGFLVANVIFFKQRRVAA